MDERMAAKLLAAAYALDAGFGDLDKLVSRIPDPEERKALASGLGDAIGAVNSTFISPILERFPELKSED